MDRLKKLGKSGPAQGSQQRGQGQRNRGSRGRGRGGYGSSGSSSNNNNGSNNNDSIRSKLKVICLKFNSSAGCQRSPCSYFHLCKKINNGAVCGEAHSSDQCPH